MISYSLNGYLAALMMRGKKSLLLEGNTDRTVITRFIRELESNKKLKPNSIVVDIIDLIKDNELPIGNRIAVEYVHYKAIQESLPLAALVDREFRKFNITSSILEDEITIHYCKDNLFWTRGHSIENYLFNRKYFAAYLCMKYPESISDQCLHMINIYFEEILRITAAISLSAFACGLITVCNGIYKQSFWEFPHNDQIIFQMDFLGDSIKARSISEDLIDRFKISFQQFYEQLCCMPDVPISRWISHGHLGWQGLWSAIAGMLRACGITGKMLEDVERGFLDEKMRYIIDRWTSDVTLDNSESPNALWEWILT